MTPDHKPGCEALGGYGNGVGACACTPDKQAAPSGWEGMYQGYVSVLTQCYYDNDHWVEYDDVAQIAAEADSEIAALRAHLESREALVKQLAEALEELHYAHTDKADAMARAALAAYQEKT
jgi:hypothetical protein